jgi:hypothetical protein
MARKTSIYVDAAGDSILAARDSGTAPLVKRHGRRSLIFRELLRRYDEICRNNIPDLSESEWALLLKAGEPWTVREDIDSGVRVGRLLTAAHKNERLMRRLLDLGHAHRISLVDFIERYWAAKARSEEPLPLPLRDDSSDHDRRRESARK